MRIGYACLTLGVPGTNLSACQLKNATPQLLRRLTIEHLSALERMLEYNAQNQIRLFRISSDLIPFASHPVNTIPWWEEQEEELKHIGDIIAKYDIRVSMHPGQYTVLNSPDKGVVERAVQELCYHARLLDALCTKEDSKLILHVGGSYGNKEEAAKRFINEYRSLPEEVRRRLIIENDEKCYDISEVLRISEKISCPVVFDNLHHKINPPQEQKEELDWMLRCRDTWSLKDGNQKLHYSQQKVGATPGSHSDTILASDFYSFYQQLPAEKPDIMLEVKDKNLSAVKCLNIVSNATAANLEEEWAKYKYYILSKSAKAYQAIRELLKNKKAEVALEFYDVLEKAASLPEDMGAEVNAAQHVWGYISEDCTKKEKERYESLLKAYLQGRQSIQPLKKHLLRSAQLRDLSYLIHSLYFYI